MASSQTNGRHVVYREQSKESIVIQKRPPSGENRFLKYSNSSSLEILEPEDSIRVTSNIEKDNRPSSTGKKTSGIGSVPPRQDSALSRRTPTPTKQIALQAVRRKEDKGEPFTADIDWKELQSHSRNKGRNDVQTDQLQNLSLSNKQNKQNEKSAIPFSYHTKHHNCSSHGHTQKPDKKETSKAVSEARQEKNKATSESGAAEVMVGHAKDDDEDDDDEDDDDTSSDDEEKRKAPNQLLMEFVTCLMEKDYLNAQKLCKMILLYEPENAEALNFQPLIDEKIALDNEPEYGSEESDEEEGYGEDNDEEDDEDAEGTADEDSDSDSSDSDTDSDSDEDSDETEQENHRLDSGIASATGSEI